MSTNSNGLLSSISLSLGKAADALQVLQMLGVEVDFTQLDEQQQRYFRLSIAGIINCFKELRTDFEELNTRYDIRRVGTSELIERVE